MLENNHDDYLIKQNVKINQDVTWKVMNYMQ